MTRPTRSRLERLEGRHCAAMRQPARPIQTPAVVTAAADAWRDDVAAALERIITEAPCGCWLVAMPGEELIVPCGDHDWGQP